MTLIYSSNASITKAMQLAASLGHETVFIILLSKISDPNAYDDDGRTALHLAAQNGHPRIIKLLLDKGAQVLNHDMTPSEQTPVHAAAANGHESCLKIMLDNTEDSEVIFLKSRNLRVHYMHFPCISIEIGKK